MKNLKTKLLSIAILFIIFSIQSEAQISKGAYILDFGSSISYTNDGAKRPTGSFNISYLKLVGNRIMLGADLNYLHGYNAFRSNFIGINYFSYNSYVFTPTIRCYIITGKFAPFVSVENRFLRTKYVKKEVVSPQIENTSGYQTILGVGANYFLSNRIALEAKATSNVINTGDNADDKKYLAFNLGFRLFFNSKLSNTVDSLPSKILKKGNITTAARLNFNYQFGDYAYTYFNFAPNLSYHVMDKLYINAALRYSQNHFRKSKVSDTYDYSIGLGLGVGYYFKLSNSLYLNPSVGFNINYSDRGYDQLLLKENRYLSTPIAISLNYFAKQKRFYLGGRYDRVKEERDIMYIIGGMHYYVFDNVYFSADVNLKMTEYIYSSGRNTTQTLTFGMGYLFN